MHFKHHVIHHVTKSSVCQTNNPCQWEVLTRLVLEVLFVMFTQRTSKVCYKLCCFKPARKLGYCLISYVPLCVGGSKGKAGIQMWCIPERRDTNNLYPGGWCRSLYRHNKSTIDCGFEFVDNIESINLNLVTTCFLTGKPLLIVGFHLLIILSL